MLRFASSSVLLRPLSWAFAACARPLQGVVAQPQLQYQRVQRPQLAFLTMWRSKSCLKTNKSVAKRFRTRGDGSLKRNHAGASHNTGYKSRSRCNRLRQSGLITEPKMEKRMKVLMGV
ncbi:hypothetical protein MHU86_6362 [Fragilaria crotonensis]|nr:hypothetical protein MHU86_6362 [Fragilaria crotonensis]